MHECCPCVPTLSCEVNDLKAALAWLVKYRDTTVIPPDGVAATLRQARLSPVRGVPSETAQDDGYPAEVEPE